MQNTHDPPARTGTDLPAFVDTPDLPLSDAAVLRGRTRLVKAQRQALAAERADLLASDAYKLLALKLETRLLDEPMELIRDMAEGRYRWKRHRDRRPVIRDGHPVPEYMSFRTIAVELERITGEQITYETLRRWWFRIWPDTIPGAASRDTDPEPPGDLGVAQLDEARREATAGQTNPHIPPAAFMPPAA